MCASLSHREHRVSVCSVKKALTYPHVHTAILMVWHRHGMGSAPKIVMGNATAKTSIQQHLHHHAKWNAIELRTEWTKRSENRQRNEQVNSRRTEKERESDRERNSREKKKLCETARKYEMKIYPKETYDSQYCESWCVREHRNRISIAHSSAHTRAYVCACIVASTCLKSLNNDGIRVSSH